MKKKTLLLFLACLVILLVGAGLLWRNQLDPQARAIHDAKNYKPEGGCVQIVVTAVHEKTGARYTFPDGCLPPGWSSVSSPDPSNPSTPPGSTSETFDIEAFYNNLQIGTFDNDVIKLAGRQPDDCVSTDSEPPSVTCFWYSGNKTVSVSYGQTSHVQAKNKEGF